MKHLKKPLSILLTLPIIISTGVLAFAEPDEVVTVPAPVTIVTTTQSPDTLPENTIQETDPETIPQSSEAVTEEFTEKMTEETLANDPEETIGIAELTDELSEPPVQTDLPQTTTAANPEDTESLQDDYIVVFEIKNVKYSKEVQVLIQNQTTQKETTLVFTSDQKYYLSANLEPGEYIVKSVKTDTKDYKVSIENTSFTVESKDYQGFSFVAKEKQANAVWKLIKSNIFLIIAFIGVGIAYFVVKRRQA